MLGIYNISKNVLVKSDDGNILYYYDIGENEKKQLVEDYLIDPHNMTSALDPDEVGRMEIENDKLTLIWKVPTSFKLGEESTFNITSVGFFLSNERLIILSMEQINYFKERINFQIKSLFDVIFLFLNNSIKHYIEHLKIIKLLSRDIQKKINKSMENEHLIQMFNLSEILVFYLDAINSNKIVLNKLLGYLKTKKIPVNLSFLNDLIIENEQASKQAEIYSQVFAGLMDARGSIVNNNMNVLIKNLTIINIIFLPLNLIASIGGMSEYSFITKGIPWQISYGVFSLSMVVIGWITLLLINKMGNINRIIKKRHSGGKKSVFLKLFKEKKVKKANK
ncbi:MAG: magnesium transporter CorA family protein [Spirochaetes bacterium]|nr:magnesium transporter CorA family protein [Spirochaetota bacterium]